VGDVSDQSRRNHTIYEYVQALHSDFGITKNIDSNNEHGSGRIHVAGNKLTKTTTVTDGFKLKAATDQSFVP